MVSQYPNDIKVISTAPATRDTNGSFPKNVPPVISWFKGRFEPGGAASQSGSPSGPGTQAAGDGKKVEDTGIVYVPHGTVQVNIGAAVEVYFAGDLVAKGTSKGFSKAQFNCRIWL